MIIELPPNQHYFFHYSMKIEKKKIEIQKPPYINNIVLKYYEWNYLQQSKNSLLI
jgi:hypothetical protein